MFSKFLAFFGGVAASALVFLIVNLIANGHSIHLDAVLIGGSIIGSVNAAVLCYTDNFRSSALRLALYNAIGFAGFYAVIGIVTFWLKGRGGFYGLDNLAESLVATLVMFFMGGVIGLGFRTPRLIGRKLRGQRF
jgi:hypothetical protein